MGITINGGDGGRLRLLPPATCRGDAGQVSHRSLRWRPARQWAGKRTPAGSPCHLHLSPPDRVSPFPYARIKCPQRGRSWGDTQQVMIPSCSLLPTGGPPPARRPPTAIYPPPWALQPLCTDAFVLGRATRHLNSPPCPGSPQLPAHPRLHPPEGLPAGVTLLRQGCLLPRYPSAQGCLSRQPPAGERWHRYRAMSAPHWPAHRRPRWVGCWGRPCSVVQVSGISRTRTTCCLDQCCLYMRDARRKEPNLCTCGVTTA